MAVTDDLWEAHADWWIDGFTEGADPEYVEQILPMAVEELSGFGRVLDVGCGDGQISRLLAGAGASVVGIDPTWNQIRIAHERSRRDHLSATPERMAKTAEKFESITTIDDKGNTWEPQRIADWPLQRLYNAGAFGRPVPIMLSRVTSAASASSSMPSVPSGRIGSTR